MQRRSLLKALAAGGSLGSSLLPASLLAQDGEGTQALSVDQLPALEGELTLYLGRGEGGLYENVLEAIQQRNPDFELNIRRGPTASLANAIVAEAGAGVRRADMFWAVDTGAIGLISNEGLARDLPDDLVNQLQDNFRYRNFVPVTGRIRTLPFNTERLTAERIPTDVIAIPDSGLSIGWAPAYASFQSFVTAMRLLEGEQATGEWLQKMDRVAKSYAGELGVVMAVERGEVDMGFANHYYSLRLKSGKPDATVDLAFTNNDAGCLVNASAIVALSEGELPINFMRYLLTREVQSFLANEAYEIPLVNGVAPPEGLPELSVISPPDVNLTRLADLRPTLDLMRDVGVL